MGKPKNKRKFENGGQSKKQTGKKRKRQKQERFWIEDCKQLSPPADKDNTIVLTVEITRADLTDEHTYNEDQVRSKLESKQVDTDGIELPSPGAAPLDQPGTGDNESKVKEAAPEPVKKSSLTPKNIAAAFIHVHRAPSALAPPKKFPRKENFQHLPNGDCGDGVVNPHSTSEVPDKYWAQRKRLFSRFDHGIQLDKPSWYSVTPEAIARHIAERVVEMKNTSGLVILDAFCGCGGNSIQFALLPQVSLVICVDTDLSKLEMAANNAKVYGVDTNKLLLLHSDACSVLECYRDGKRISAKSQGGKEASDDKNTEMNGFTLGGLELLPSQLDAIFLSPPWGGMDYGKVGRRRYNVKTCIQVDAGANKCNGEELLKKASLAQHSVAYFLPRNINGIALGKSALVAGYTDSFELEQNVLNGKLKTVIAYFSG